MPEIAWGNIHSYDGAVKTYTTACGVIKSTPNNHPSHVGCDTRSQAPPLDVWAFIYIGRVALILHWACCSHFVLDVLLSF